MGEQIRRIEAFKLQVLNSQKQLEISFDERLGSGFATMQQQLMADLRAETATLLRNEASAVAVLDEQLWVTDQRLGQRIDDLAQVHLRERKETTIGVQKGVPALHADELDSTSMSLELDKEIKRRTAALHSSVDQAAL